MEVSASVRVVYCAVKAQDAAYVRQASSSCHTRPWNIEINEFSALEAARLLVSQVAIRMALNHQTSVAVA